MSQGIRPEDLEAGIMFEVQALGTVALGQTSITDLLALQKPLRELYLAYQKSTGVTSLPSCRLVVSNRGLAVTEAPTGPQDRKQTAETLYNIPSVVFAAAVKFQVIGKKEKDFRCAFEAIDSDGPPPTKGKNDPYVAIDKKWRHLVKVTPHPAICACVIQRMTGVRALELHAFVCESDLQARDVIFGLTSALRNFSSKEGPAPASSSSTYGHGPYDYPPQRGTPDPGMGAMRSDAEHPMTSQQQQHQQQPARVPGSAEGVYGFQGYSDQMMAAYRGADVATKPGGMRPDFNGPVGNPWDPRAQDPRSPTGEGQQGSDWLSHQRDQLMRNFNNDQRKNDPMRSQAEQTAYEQQRGVYDIQPARGIYDPVPSRGAYDPLSSKGIYDLQPSKGIYDTQPAIYEYRPPQSHGDPPRENYTQGHPAEGIYAPRRDIYDPPQAGNRAQNEPGLGNLYGPMRGMSGSSERVFDEPRKVHDLPKTNIDALRMGGNDPYRDGGTESDYSMGFAIPRVKVSYDPDGPSNARNESIPSGGEYGASHGRPTSLGYDTGPVPPPQDASIDRRNKTKAQPPAPLAKTRVAAPTSPSTEVNPGLRSSGGPGPVRPESDALPQSSMPVVAKKVKGIKVFPTMMLRGNQAAAMAAAVDEEGDSADGRPPSKDTAQSSHVMENLRSAKQQPNGNGPEKQPANLNRAFGDAAADDLNGQDRRRKDEEIEYALGSLAVDSSRTARKSGNDFEQSLGYLP